MKFAASAVVVALFGLSLPAQQKEKKVKDQAEYDLLMAVNKETVPAKKIELLNQWKEKYADSDYKEDRAQLLCQTWQQAGDAKNMWTACEDLHKLAPKNFLALFFLTSLTLSMNDPSRFDAGEGYTKKFQELIPEVFAADKKPAQVNEEQWKKERLSQESLARKVLGHIAMQKKDFVKAEEIYSEYLKANPSSGNISYALGNAILLQKKKEKQIPALWHLARAANYSGEDALPDASRKQLGAFFEKTYIGYHGSNEGMKEVIDAALKDPFPPADFKIKSSFEMDEERMERIKAENPQLYMWLNVKQQLAGSGGAAYWEQIKGSGTPKLKGKVISAEPAAKPKEVVIGLSNDQLPEVKLVLESAVGKVDPGTEVEFEGGLFKDFAADPFLVTVEIENDKVTGLPKAAPGAKAVTKKAAGAKKGVGRKK